MKLKFHFSLANTKSLQGREHLHIVYMGTSVPAPREGNRPKNIHSPRAASLPVMQGLKMGFFIHKKWWLWLNEDQAFSFCHWNKAAKLMMDLSLQIWCHCLPSTRLQGTPSVQTPFLILLPPCLGTSQSSDLPVNEECYYCTFHQGKGVQGD